MAKLVRLLFFLSGAAALLYQTLWFRLLGHVLGTSTQALGVVTATFMAGLALGGFLLGRLADRTPRPMRLYAIIEVAIAVVGGALVLFDSEIARLVSAIGASDDGGGYGLRVVVAAAILLVPCTLIGGTLPVMIRAVVHGLEHLGEEVGTLYFANTLGAAAGTLAGGLVLFEAIGLHATAWVAMAVNVIVALGSLLLESRLAPKTQKGTAETTTPATARETEPTETPEAKARTSLKALVLAAFFLSGFTGLALEVLWARILFGFIVAGAQAFHILLATLLVGLALGGVVGAGVADKVKVPSVAAGIGFVVVGAMVLVGLDQIGHLELLEGIARRHTDRPPFVAIIGLVAPAALAMGVLFPLLVKGLLTDATRLGTDAGRYYAVNTLGTVLGALSASFLAIPAIGVSQSTVVIALLDVSMGIVLVVTARGAHRLTAPTLATVGVATIFCLVRAPSQWDAFHTAVQQQAVREFPDWSEEVAFVEGSESTVSMYRRSDGSHYRVVVNAFPFVALSTNETKLMAHVPMLAAPEPLRTLVICFGMGNTYRSALSYGGRVDIAEINAHIPQFTRIHRGPEDHTLTHPNGRIFINDGRNHLLMSSEHYDMITVDPAPPISSMGMQNLYTREFFELGRDHLTERGIMMQWTPSSPHEFIPILRAFLDVFPYVQVFQGLDYPDAHYLLGSRVPIVFDEAIVSERLARPAVRADIDEFTPGYFTVETLRKMYRTDGVPLRELTANIEPLTDDRPILEFSFLQGPAPRTFFNVPQKHRTALPWVSATPATVAPTPP